MLKKRVLTALFCLGLCGYVNAKDKKPSKIVESATSSITTIESKLDFEKALKEDNVVVSFYKEGKLRDISDGLEDYARLNPDHKCFECIDEDVKKAANVDGTCIVVYNGGEEVERHKTDGILARSKLYLNRVLVREQ